MTTYPSDAVQVSDSSLAYLDGVLSTIAARVKNLQKERWKSTLRKASTQSE